MSTADEMRVIAIDWSGAVTGAAKKIWLAEALDGQIVRLESGRTRDQITEHLIALKAESPSRSGYPRCHASAAST